MTEENLLDLKSSAELRDEMILLSRKFDTTSGEEREQAVSQWNILNHKLNPLYDEGGSIDVVLPRSDYAIPYLEIKTFRYSDGKWAYGLGVFINESGMSYGFNDYDLSETKEEAIQKAAADALQWVASSEKGCNSKTNKAILDKIKKACLTAIEEAKHGKQEQLAMF